MYHKISSNDNDIIQFSSSESDCNSEDEGFAGYDADDEQICAFKCPICLVPKKNKAYASTCFHQICFSCLLNAPGAKCPICHRAFDRILYDCHSASDFKLFHLPQPSCIIRDEPSWIAGKQCAPVAFRRLVYENSWYVEPRMTCAGRIVHSCRDRDRNRFRAHLSDVEWFAKNESRLISWLVRELSAIAPEEAHYSFMQLLDQLKTDDSDDPVEAFSELLNCTRGVAKHFAHELMAFAAAELDMCEYDAQAVYFEAGRRRRFLDRSMLPVNLTMYRLLPPPESHEKGPMGARLKLARHFVAAGADKEDYIKRVLMQRDEEQASLKRNRSLSDISQDSVISSSSCSLNEDAASPRSFSPDLSFELEISSDHEEMEEPENLPAPPPTPEPEKKMRKKTKPQQQRRSGSKRTQRKAKKTTL